MKYQRGNYAVVRNCCTSGLCVDCHGGPDRLQPPKARPSQVVQGTGYSEAYASFVAKNWAAYGALVVPA